jgi:DNA replication protein DnaC
MRKVEEVLRLKWGAGRSVREIARVLGIGRTTVSAYLERAEAAGLSWPLPAGLNAGELERRLFKPLKEQLQMPEIQTLGFEERLGLLLDRELSIRENRRLQTRLKQAKLRESAAIEDLDYRVHRGLDKALMSRLAGSQWIREHLNVIITGPTGVGKTWIACALAHKACRDGFTVRYQRLPRLLQDLAIARAEGRYTKLLTELARTELLVLDDWGLAVLAGITGRFPSD